MTVNDITYFMVGGSIFVTCAGRPYNIGSADPRFSDVKKCLETKCFADLSELLDPNRKFLVSDVNFSIADGLLHYKGEPLPSVIADTIYQNPSDDNKGLIYSQINFWINVKKRLGLDKQRDAVRVLESGGYSVTIDGFYIAYNSMNMARINNDEKFLFDYNYTDNNIAAMFRSKWSFDRILEECVGFTGKKTRALVLSLLFNKTTGSIDDSVLRLSRIVKGKLSESNFQRLISKPVVQFRAVTFDNCRNLNSFLSDFAPSGSKSESGDARPNSPATDTSEARVLNFVESKILDLDRLNTLAADYVLVKAHSLDLTELRNVSNQFDKIYDYIAHERKKIDSGDFKLNMMANPLYAAMDGFVTDKLRFVVPKFNSDLVSWSTIMNNCVHGHGRRVINGDCAVFAIMAKESDKMLYNLDIRNNGIYDFAGRGNAVPSVEEKNEIKAILLEKKLIGVHTE
jgi:hypothetical protein